MRKTITVSEDVWKELHRIKKKMRFSNLDQVIRYLLRGQR